MSPDPVSNGAIWVHDLLFSSVLPIIASIAIAFVGFRMLGGKIAPRRGIIIITGLFLSLGAPIIARGLMPGEAMLSAELPKVSNDPDASPRPVPPMEQSQPRSPYSRSSVGS